MAVEIIWDPRKLVACMWDNTTDQAFGPVFSGPSADVEVQEFLDWLRESAASASFVKSLSFEGDGTDPRHYQAGELAELVKYWCDIPSVEYVGDDELREPDGTRYLGGGRYGSTSR